MGKLFSSNNCVLKSEVLCLYQTISGWFQCFYIFSSYHDMKELIKISRDELLRRR